MGSWENAAICAQCLHIEVKLKIAVERWDLDQWTRFDALIRDLDFLQTEVDLGLQNDLGVLVLKRENDLGVR